MEVTRTAGPIFIVGAPRSGTSLLRNLLNRHPAIGLCDETYFDYYVYSRRAAFGDLADPHKRAHLVSRYLAITRITRLGVDLDALRQALLRDGPTYPDFFATLLRFYAGSLGKTRYGEKTPQHATFAATLCDWFPDCSLLHLVRDPRDVVVSLLDMPWGRRTAAANARMWRRCVAAAEKCGDRANYLRVRYEDLAIDPEPELRRICAFIGEPYDPIMLTATDRPPATAWWFERASGAVTGDRIAVWRERLTPTQVRRVEDIVGSHLANLGYAPAATRVPWALRTRARAEEALDAAREQVRQLPRICRSWITPTRLAAEEARIDAQRDTGRSGQAFRA